MWIMWIKSFPNGSVFSSFWFDSGYIFLAVHGGLVFFTHSCVKVDLGSWPEVDSVLCRRFLDEFHTFS